MIDAPERSATAVIRALAPPADVIEPPVPAAPAGRLRAAAARLLFGRLVAGLPLRSSCRTARSAAAAVPAVRY